MGHVWLSAPTGQANFMPQSVQGQSHQPNFGSANAEYKHIEEGIDGSFGMMELLAAFWLGRLAAMSRRVSLLLHPLTVLCFGLSHPKQQYLLNCSFDYKFV